MRALLLLLAFAGSATAQTLPTTASGKFPALSVQVTVGTRQRPEAGSSYRKMMTVEPKMTIEAPSKMSAIPAAEAVMLIITMDTQAKYREKREVYLVHGTETLAVPEAKTGARREFSFAQYEMRYDSYRDSSNIGGEVYKYYVFALRDPETKALIDFKTNNPPLASFVKAHPEKREELLAIPKGKNFPADFKP